MTISNVVCDIAYLYWKGTLNSNQPTNQPTNNKRVSSFLTAHQRSEVSIIIIIIITDEYDLGGTVALLLQDHLTLLIVSHVTTNQSTTA